jgi:hypothetical protein
VTLVSAAFVLGLQEGIPRLRGLGKRNKWSRAMARDIGRFVREENVKTAKSLEQQIRGLEQRLQALESVKYCGTWQRDVPYRAGSSVTHRDGIWIAKVDNRSSCPGESADWQLALRRGRSDGKDLRDTVQ